jgi:hypothetical protein
VLSKPSADSFAVGRRQKGEKNGTFFYTLHFYVAENVALPSNNLIIVLDTARQRMKYPRTSNIYIFLDLSLSFFTSSYIIAFDVNSKRIVLEKITAIYNSGIRLCLLFLLRAHAQL